MARKLMIILLLLGFCTSVVAWVAQVRKPVLIYSSSLPENLLNWPGWPVLSSMMSERSLRIGHSEVMRPPMGTFSFGTGYGSEFVKTQKVTRTIGCAFLAEGALIARIGNETIITDCQNRYYFEYDDSVYFNYERLYPANRTCRIPIWSIAVGCAVASGLLTVPPVLRRRKRARRGQCLHCGYDLRGSTERCPECGMAFGADRLILKADR